MLISVIIPHLNQDGYLRAVLESLYAQEGYGGAVEVIVVDNGSKDLPEAVCDAFPGVILDREETPGPGPARNKGVGMASGEVIAFIDADCRAHRNWLLAIEEAFANPELQIIGGDVYVGYVDPGNPTFVEPYEAIYSFRNHEHIAEGYSATLNMALRAEIFPKVGAFAGIDIAEDQDWGLRAAALGYRTEFVAAMIVNHPARKSFTELTRKWDRHIAHGFEEFGTKRFGRLRWLARAVAVAGSPLFEIPRVLRSDRVSGARARGLAFLCLLRLRLYRAARMIELLFRGNSASMSGAWNRK